MAPLEPGEGKMSCLKDKAKELPFLASPDQEEMKSVECLLCVRLRSASGLSTSPAVFKWVAYVPLWSLPDLGVCLGRGHPSY